MNKLELIRDHRRRTGVSLVDAKAVIDARLGTRPPAPPTRDYRIRDLERAVDDLDESLAKRSFPIPIRRKVDRARRLLSEAAQALGREA